MIDERHANLLKELATDEVAHFRGTLFEHLVGTHQLLEDWGNRPEVCVAGLFHSVYGTQAFRRTTVDLGNRERVREVIGAEAEELAYLFCVMDRRELFERLGARPAVVVSWVDGTHREVSPEVVRSLVEIDAANFLEQALRMPDLPTETLDRAAARCRVAHRELSPSASSAVTEFVARRRR